MNERAGLRPRVGVVLGSGLGAVAEAVSDPTSDRLRRPARLPGAERGGPRRARRCWAASATCRWRCSRAARTCTRAATSSEIRVPVRALRAAGAEILVLTNAAGSLRRGGRPRRPDADLRPHQPERRERARRAERRRDRPALPEHARRLRPEAARRVPRRGGGARHRRSPRACTSRCRGPTFETPAEIRAFAQAWSRRRRDVHRPRDRGGAALRPAGGGGLGDHELRGGHERRSRSATSRRCATPQRAADDLAPLLVRFVERLGRVTYVPDLIRVQARRRRAERRADPRAGRRASPTAASATLRWARSRWRSCSTG